MEILAALDGDLLSLLIFAVISGLSALSNWLQKRNAQQEEFLPPAPPPVRRSSAPPPTSTPRQQGRSTPSAPPVPTPTPASAESPRQVLTDWEAELRRLLGEPSPPPPVEPTPVPSPVSTPPPLPQPTARQVQSPPFVGGEGVPSSRTGEPSFMPVQGRVAWDRVEEGASVEGAEAPTRPLATLSQSARGYGAASRLHETVALRMKEISRQRTERSVKLTEVTRRDRPHSADASMFLNPKSLRQAMIASFILGPPRSLE